MSRPEIPDLRTWPRNLSTGLYGGLSTGLYGGMSTGLYGGMSTGLYGGMSTGLYGGLSTALYGGLSTALYGGLSTAIGGGMSTSSSNVYRSNIPPWPVFLLELEKRGYHGQVQLIRHHILSFLYPENFF